MAHTIHFDAKIGKNRKVELTLPADVPTGNAEMTLVVVPKRKGKASSRPTVEQEFAPLKLLEAAAGLWAHRDDIADPASYARELRERAWNRQP